MSRPLLHIVAFAASLVVGLSVAGAQFDGQPSAPQPFSSHAEFEDWDIQIHSRDVDTWDELESMEAQHGADCAGPPASHENHSYEGAVYVCRDHLMTAISAGGYGVIYLTPNLLLDFSRGPGTVQWNMSTERMSKRDWPDVWITPYEDNLALPFADGEVDLQNTPKNAIHIASNNSQGSFQLRTIKKGEETRHNRADATPPIQAQIADGTNQAATRQTFLLTVSDTSVKLERLASATGAHVVFFEEFISNLGFSSGVVQFGHHSYNPEKDNSGVPATWHWDDIQISPAISFAIVHAMQRYTEGGVVHFDEPAPANSFLRFSAIGAVKVNDVTVKPQIPTEHHEHFNSYFVPVAAGTTSVRIEFSADDWYKGPFRAKDLSFWSLEPGSPSRSETAPLASPIAVPSGSLPPITPPSTGDGTLHGKD